MTFRFIAFSLFLLATTGPATSAPLEQQVFEQSFSDWTATIVKDLVLQRNKCRLSTTDGGDKGSTDTATFRFNLIRRAHSTSWSSAAYLPQIIEKSDIALTIDGTTHHDLKSEFVSTSTVYLSNEFSITLLQDFFTGELLGESLTIDYQDTAGAARSAKFSLEGFADTKKTLETKCETL